MIAAIALLLVIPLAAYLVQSLMDGGDVTESVAGRYALIIASQAIFVLVPIRVALIWKAGPESLGLRRYSLRSIAEGAAAGVILFLLSYGYSLAMSVVAPEAYERFLNEQVEQLALLEGPFALQLALAVLLAPAAEEIFFRGFCFGGLRGRFGFAVASGVSAALFAAAHWMPLAAAPLFAIGLGMAVLYERHGALAPAMLAHATYNLISLSAGPV